MLIIDTSAAINQLVQTLREMAELTDESLAMVTFNIARLDGMSSLAPIICLTIYPN